MTSVRTRSKAKKEQTFQQKCQGLFQAIQDRKLETAKSYLEAGAKSNYISPSGNLMLNPFHAALPKYEGQNQKEEAEGDIHIELLDLLIDEKYSDPSTLNIFTEDSYGYNAFEWVCADGKPRTVRWFLGILQRKQFKHIANQTINRQNPLPSTLLGEKCKRIKYQTPIQLAVKSESLETIRALCGYIPRPNVGEMDDNHQNAIHLAIQRRIPYVLYELVNIASICDLEIQNENEQSAMEYAQYCYDESLNKAVLPWDILCSWQCKEVVKARLDHSLRKRWEDIKRQQQPTHNAVIAFWKFNEEKNPNTNALKTANIGSTNYTISYRLVSFEEACTLQHQNAKWMTTHHGILDVNERYIFKQKLSPFAQQYKALLCKRREQLNAPIATESDYIEYEQVRKKSKTKGLSVPVFEYQHKWIKVEALNKELDKELTLNDRIQFYEYSIGRYKTNDKLEIREILNRCHPCKRHNMDESVFGLFAATNVAKKTIIGEYTGLVCTSDEYEAQIGHFERFDGQFRTYKFDSLDPHHSGYHHNKFMINGSYFSNECVFVNDATRDDVYGKWNIHNVSFFEICINEWPHTFLRAFDDIEKGEELLTDYGCNFWRNYNHDMNISKQLNKYHVHRLEREEQVQRLWNKTNRKRKRNDIENEEETHNVVCVRKKRKICNDTVSVIECNDTETVDNDDGNGDIHMDGSMNSPLKQQMKRNRILFKLYTNSELKHNAFAVEHTQSMQNMQHEISMLQRRLKEKDEELRMKDELNETLQQQIEITATNTLRKKLKRLNEEMPEILKKVKLLQRQCRDKDRETKSLNKREQETQEQFNEMQMKKRKYKDKCRYLLQYERNDETYNEVHP